MTDTPPDAISRAIADDEWIAFGPFRFRPGSGLLLRDGAPVPVPPRALAVLRCLLEHRGEVVTRDQLIEEVWEGSAVTEHSVNEGVNVLRQALGDDPHDPKYIQTVHRKGYRFVAAVSREPETDADDRRPAAGRRRSADRVAADPWPSRPAVAVLLLLAVTIGAVAGWWWAGGSRAPRRPGTEPILRASISLPDDARLRATFFNPTLDLSADGRRLVYVAELPRTQDGEVTQILHVRNLRSGRSEAIPGTREADAPFFGPNAESIAYFAAGSLATVTLDGHMHRTLADAPRGRGGDWSDDGDTIIYCPGPGRGLWRVPVDDGGPEAITEPDAARSEAGHYWPQILPDDRHVLFTIWRRGKGFDGAEIAVLDLDDGEYETLLPGGAFARYVDPGYLVFARSERLMVVPFDLGRLEVLGAPVPVAEGVVTTPINGTAQFAVADGGSLVYVEGKSPFPDTQVVRVGRGGDVEPVSPRPRKYYGVRVSPSGRLLALTILHKNSMNVWLHDRERGATSRLTYGERDLYPVWSPDGRRVVYAATGSGHFDLYCRRVGSRDDVDLLWRSEFPVAPGSWSPDGRYLAFTEYAADTRGDLWLVDTSKGDGSRDDGAEASGRVSGRSPRAGEPGRLGTTATLASRAGEGGRSRGKPEFQAEPLIRSEFFEGGARFSPDGRWIAYHSDESGQFEVYARRFEGDGSRIQVSVAGGSYPVWGRDGDELFYRNGNKMLSVSLGSPSADRLRATAPRLLFEGSYAEGPSTYDADPDTGGFVMIDVQEMPAVSRLELIHGPIGELVRDDGDDRSPAGPSRERPDAR